MTHNNRAPQHFAPSQLFFGGGGGGGAAATVPAACKHHYSSRARARNCEGRRADLVDGRARFVCKASWLPLLSPLLLSLCIRNHVYELVHLHAVARVLAGVMYVIC